MAQVGTAAPRIASIDALRGFVMFTMIYVNDLDENIAPPWMKHFHGPNGLTFVDLVFPAFIFIVGMSIPIALGSRLDRGESALKIFGHVLVRTVSLLAIGIMMVNGETYPSAQRMGFSPSLWEALMFASALAAFCTIGKSAAAGVATSGMTGFLRMARALAGGAK